MKKWPFVSVAVVTRDSEEYIGDCIESLLELDYPKDRYEVIVIDGLSVDKSVEIIKKYKRIKLVINKDKFCPQGRNLAIKVSKGDYIAFTDSDCIVKKDWLTTLVSGILNADQKVVAVGGPNKVFEDDPSFAKLVGYAQETFLGSGGSPQSYGIPKPRYVYSIPNCNSIYKLGVIKNEKYDTNLHTGEDCDLNYSLTKKGYKILYLPNAIVWHHRRNSFKSFVKHMFSYGKAMAMITKKNKDIIRWYSLPPFFMAIMLILFLPLVFLSSIFFYVYLLFFSIYLFLLLIATYSVHKKIRTALSLLTLILVPIHHISYGLGFIFGLLRPYDKSINMIRTVI